MSKSRFLGGWWVAVLGAAVMVGGVLPIASAAVPGDGLLEHAAELRDPDPVDGELAGTSVAIDGDTMVVGAPGDHAQGRVLVFERDPVTRAWRYTATLKDPNGGFTDDFGASVALRGDLLAAGDPMSLGQRGKVHVFRRSSGSWLRVAALTTPHPADGDRLGTSVAVGVSIVVAGAPGAGNSCAGCGAVHVFKGSGTSWSHDQQILMPGALGTDGFHDFGRSVALGGDYLAVGNPGASLSPGVSGSGVIAVFMRGYIDGKPSWVPFQVLANPTLTSGARLGTSVAIDGDVVVGGGPEDSKYASAQGSVTVFERSVSSFSRTATLRAPDFAEEDHLGASVDVEAGLVIGGAQHAGAGGSYRGLVHVFTTAGSHVQRLAPPEAANYDCFGSGVAINGGVVVAGAPETYDDPSSARWGVAHVFEDLPAELLCGGFGVTVRGTAGSETLEGTAFRDVIRGYGGDDTLKGLGGNDVICGDDGNDVLLGGPGDDVLYGGDGNDKLRAAAGDDLLDGGPGSDRLLPEAGEDSVNGGAGSDIVDYLAGAGPVSVNLALGTATYTPPGESWSQTLVAVEKVDGSSFADTLVGDGKRNLLRGKQGADVIRGGGDDDTLVGGTGADTVYGGDGNDLVKGQADDDQLFGESGNDRVVGGHGEDELSGGPGNDVLRGGLLAHRGVFTNHLDGGTGTDDCLWPFDVLTNCE